MWSPSPRPFPRVLNPGSNTRARRSWGTPRPESSTQIATPAPSRATETRTRRGVVGAPASGARSEAASAAFTTRFAIARRSSPGSQRAKQSSSFATRTSVPSRRNTGAACWSASRTARAASVALRGGGAGWLEARSGALLTRRDGGLDRSTAGCWLLSAMARAGARKLAAASRNPSESVSKGSRVDEPTRSTPNTAPPWTIGTAVPAAIPAASSPWSVFVESVPENRRSSETTRRLRTARHAAKALCRAKSNVSTWGRSSVGSASEAAISSVAPTTRYATPHAAPAGPRSSGSAPVHTPCSPAATTRASSRKPRCWWTDRASALRTVPLVRVSRWESRSSPDPAGTFSSPGRVLRRSIVPGHNKRCAGPTYAAAPPADRRSPARRRAQGSQPVTGGVVTD